MILKPRWKRLILPRFRRRRLGAEGHLVAETQYAAMKARRVPGDAPRPAHRSPDDIGAHFANLEGEFAGQPELCLYLAKLIVMLRRDVDPAPTYARYRRLWEMERDFLLRHLSLRWLVSAADTFADRGGEEYGPAILASVMANMAKVAETDRFLHPAPDDHDPARFQILREGPKPMFDGMTYLAAGTDDSLINLRRRMEPAFRQGIAGAILREVFRRLNDQPTALHRMRRLNRRDATRWWD